MVPRLLSVLLALAVLAAPAVAQQGPPPGQTDPLAYAQDHVAEQAKNATSDPTGYAQGTDPVATAEHAAWLACWAAYDTAGDLLDPACRHFFAAPVKVDPAPDVEGEAHAVLNDTGVDALANETLDLLNDTLADPASVLQQAERAARAVTAFVARAVAFVLDVLGLGGMAIAGGLLGAVLGVLELLDLAAAGFALAAQGLATVGAALAHLGALLGSAATAADQALAGALQAALATLLDASRAAAHGVAGALAAFVAASATVLTAAAGQSLDVARDTVAGVAGAAKATVHGIGDAVADAVEGIARLFDDGAARGDREEHGLDAPKTGTEADGLVDRVLDLL